MRWGSISTYVKEVRDLLASDEFNDELLEAVSNQIELGAADVISMFISQSQGEEGRVESQDSAGH